MSVFSLEVGGGGGLGGAGCSYIMGVFTHVGSSFVNESFFTYEKGSTPTGLVSQEHQHGGLEVL